MAKNDERNQFQIARQDGRNCFVESKSDCFEIGKAHLEFAQYDTSRPEGQRFTNHVHIYMDMAEFLHLAHTILNDSMHIRMKSQKEAMAQGRGQTAPLFQSLGGVSAEVLARRGKARPDGMSLSRSVQLFVGEKKDYLLTAQSGAGQTDQKGLIVPRYGSKPENRVSIAMNWPELTKFVLITKVHYEGWLSAFYHERRALMQQRNEVQ
ncbi:MAG: hypothetical protein SNG49_09705 [Rikenellaceae bacterium]